MVPSQQKKKKNARQLLEMRCVMCPRNYFSGAFNGQIKANFKHAHKAGSGRLLPAGGLGILVPSQQKKKKKLHPFCGARIFCSCVMCPRNYFSVSSTPILKGPVIIYDRGRGDRVQMTFYKKFFRGLLVAR